MKTLANFLRLAAMAAVLSLLTLPESAMAQAEKPTAAAGEAKPEGKRRARYVPPVTGGPKVRVGGGVRGGDQPSDMQIDVVAPDHVSVTGVAQPTLCWLQSFDGKGKSIQVTVLQPRKVKPVLKIVLDNTSKGFNQIRLADHNAKLEPNKDYQWMVSYVSDKQGRWKDLVAGAAIRYVPQTGDAGKLLAGENDLDGALGLLQAGVWYDGWARLASLYEKQPDNKELAGIHADLLSQIGLSAAPATE